MRPRVKPRGGVAVLAAALAFAPSATAQVFPPFISTVAGNGMPGGRIVAGNPTRSCVTGSPACGGDGGQARAAQLFAPDDVFPLTDGSLLIADTGDQVIRRVSAGGTITTLAGSGQPCPDPTIACGDGGPATDASFFQPRSVTALKDGTVLIADTDRQRIRKVDPSSQAISTPLGTGTQGEPNDPGGSGVTVGLRYPVGITPTGDGMNLLITEYGGRLDQFTPTSGDERSLAGANTVPPTEGYQGDGLGAGPSTQLNQPARSAAFPGGGILIADTSNHVIREINAAGTISTVAGSHTVDVMTGVEHGSAGYSGDGGPATAAQLRSPAGVAVLPDGGYLIADTGNNVIREVSPGGTISTVAGNGSTCPSPTSPCGDGGPATAATLNVPLGISALPDGSFLFADSTDNRIRSVSPEVTLTSHLALSPAAPDGQGGWYRQPVTVAVMATISRGSVVETRCQLDPGAAPAVFGALPSACPYLAGGSAVGAEGVHTVYAASTDGAGRQETPVSAAFRIDTTPPAIACPPAPSVALGSSATLTASVTDAGSGPAVPSTSSPLATSRLGSQTVSLTARDVAGNVATASCGYRVQAPRLDPFASWNVTYRGARPFTSAFVGPFTITGVPAGATVRLICRGRGCPFASRVPRAVVCRGKGRRRRCHTAPPPRGVHTVQAGGVLDAVRFAAGQTLLVAITQPQSIGKGYLFRFRRAHAPVVSKGCLVPGSLTVRRVC